MMPQIQHLFESATAGFVIKLLAAIAAVGFGILGVGAKTRSEDGKLLRSGRIALYGIVLAGILASVQAIYDFTSGERKDELERQKSERLLRSVQRGLYPLRSTTSSLYITLPENFFGLSEYRAMLRSHVPLKQNPCIPIDIAGCWNSTDRDAAYDISDKSPLFPSASSALGKAIGSIFIRLEFVALTHNSERQYKKRAEIYFRLDKLRPAHSAIEYSPAWNTVKLAMENIQLSDDLILQMGAYSLVDLMPGFVVFDTGFNSSELCESLGRGPIDASCIHVGIDFEDHILIDELILQFNYPKTIHLWSGGNFKCPSYWRHDDSVIMLPEDVEEIDEQGNFQYTGFLEHEKALCTALNDKYFDYE